MDWMFAMVAAFALVLATTAMHYEGLRLADRWVQRVNLTGRQKILLAMLTIFWIHLLEIALYAVAFWLADRGVGMGGFAGVHVFEPLGYFYFSAETFTTLGLGDMYPVGPLRVLASIEPINGLMLLGWSASFTYYLMQRFWDDGRNSPS